MPPTNISSWRFFLQPGMQLAFKVQAGEKQPRRCQQGMEQPYLRPGGSRVSSSFSRVSIQQQGGPSQQQGESLQQQGEASRQTIPAGPRSFSSPPDPGPARPGPPLPAHAPSARPSPGPPASPLAPLQVQFLLEPPAARGGPGHQGQPRGGGLLQQVRGGHKPFPSPTRSYDPGTHCPLAYITEVGEVLDFVYCDPIVICSCNRGFVEMHKIYRDR